MSGLDNVLFGMLCLAVAAISEWILNRLHWRDDPFIVGAAYVLSLVGIGGLFAVCTGWDPGFAPILLMAIILAAVARLRVLSLEVRHGP